jgi:hypothetical protein
MSDYAEYWPGQGDVAVFIAATETAVDMFKFSDTPLAPKKINAQLSRLREAIKGLSPETRELINGRELEHWQNARSNGTWFDNESFDYFHQIQNGSAALDFLSKYVAEEFRRDTQRDAVQRRHLIAAAEFSFVTSGGKIEAGRTSPFFAYLEHLFEDVGLADADCSKAIRDYLSKK